jgi:hypothetical protein
MKLFNTSEGKLLRIVNGDTLTYYRVTPLPSQFGTAFRLQKVVTGNETYDVLLDGRESSCTCKGNTYRGRCKHVDGLTILRQRGLI